LGGSTTTTTTTTTTVTSTTTIYTGTATNPVVAEAALLEGLRLTGDFDEVLRRAEQYNTSMQHSGWWYAVHGTMSDSKFKFG
jgi:hypothetical protein